MEIKTKFLILTSALTLTVGFIAGLAFSPTSTPENSSSSTKFFTNKPEVSIKNANLMSNPKLSEPIPKLPLLPVTQDFQPETDLNNFEKKLIKDFKQISEISAESYESQVIAKLEETIGPNTLNGGQKRLTGSETPHLNEEYQPDSTYTTETTGRSGKIKASN